MVNVGRKEVSDRGLGARAEKGALSLGVLEAVAEEVSVGLELLCGVGQVLVGE